MLSWYKHLNVILFFFPPLGLWSGNVSLIAPFPDHCLLLPFNTVQHLCTLYMYKLLLTYIQFVRASTVCSLVNYFPLFDENNFAVSLRKLAHAINIDSLSRKKLKFH